MSEHSKFWVRKLELDSGSIKDYEKEKEWLKKDNKLNIIKIKIIKSG